MCHSRPRRDAMSHCVLMSRIIPAASEADTHVEWHVQLVGTAHFLAYQGFRGLALTVGDLQDELVVYLEEHPAAQLRCPETAVHAQHGHLDDVRGTALDRSVERHPLGHLPALPVVRREVGQVAAPAED